MAEPRPAVACLASRLNRLHHRVAVATSLEDSQHRVDFSEQPSQPPATSSLHRPQASLSLAMRGTNMFGGGAAANNEAVGGGDDGDGMYHDEEEEAPTVQLGE